MTDQRNRLGNGRFLHNLNDWEVTGATYQAGDGDEHYGVAQLAVGQALGQAFAVDFARLHTVHVALKCAAAVSGGQATAVIEDEDGNTVTTLNLTCPANQWAENEFGVGLAPGTTYTLTLTNVSASATIKLDDVWVWYLPASRAMLAARVHAKLARLATQRSLSTAANGALTEGDYTYAVDAGLRLVGAIDPETDKPDARWLEASALDPALDAIEHEMLERLQRDYAVQTDITLGPRSEQYSQIASAIGELTKRGAGTASGAGRVVMRALRHIGPLDESE